MCLWGWWLSSGGQCSDCWSGWDGWWGMTKGENDARGSCRIGAQELIIESLDHWTIFHYSPSGKQGYKKDTHIWFWSPDWQLFFSYLWGIGSRLEGRKDAKWILLSETGWNCKIDWGIIHASFLERMMSRLLGPHGLSADGTKDKIKQASQHILKCCCCTSELSLMEL